MRRLAGKRVLLTRAEEDCASWAAELRAAGLVPVTLPCIRCQIADSAEVGAQLAATLPEADWLVFTSRRGVEAFARLTAGTGAARLPESLQLAAVGPATADAAQRLLGRVDLVAEAGTAASLAQALVFTFEGSHAKVLLALAENAAGVLEDTLRPAGAVCTRIDVYRTVPAGERTPKQALSALGADNIFLASPTAVAGLMNQVELDTDAAIFTIGPSTSAAARAAGLAVTAEATEPTLEGLMEAMRCAS